MIVIYDGNNTVIRNNAVTELYFGEKRTSGINGTLTEILSDLTALSKSYTISRVIFAWDSSGGSTRRKEIYPEYKANRRAKKEDPENQVFYEELSAQMKSLKELLPNIGIHSISVKGYEADDIIACISRNTTEPIMIVSTDKDLLQLVNTFTTVYQPTKKIVYNHKNFKELTGISKNLFLHLKVLVGDKSDNITGIHGVGEKTAIKLLEDYPVGGVFDLLVKGEKLKKKSVVLDRILSAEGRHIIQRNFQLMSLFSDNYKVLKTALNVFLGTSLEYDSKKLVEYSKEYGLKNIFINLNKYTEILKNLS